MKLPKYFYFRVKTDSKATKIILENASDCDVVEVVRCRECYFRELDGANTPVCTGAMAYSYTPDEWFCAAGKPKNGGRDE